MNPDLAGIYELHTVGRINLLDSSASSLKMITIVAQDDIDEMRAEEQAQQAEAQITMFELLRSLLSSSPLPPPSPPPPPPMRPHTIQNN